MTTIFLFDGLRSLMNAAYLHTLNPFIIEFGAGIGIRWYGLSYLLGFLACYLIVLSLAKKKQISLAPEAVSDFIFWGAMGAVLGGRVGYCLFYDTSLLNKFSGGFPFWGVLEIHHGGMASHGGLLGTIIACVLYGRLHHISSRLLLDLVSLTAGVGLFFGRLANFINGELVGRPAPADLSWAVKFPQDILLWPQYEPERLSSLSGVVKYMGISQEKWSSLLSNSVGSSKVEGVLHGIVSQIQSGQTVIANALAPLLTPRHPSQLYEAILEGLLIFLLMWTVKRWTSNAGMISACFLMAYAIMRFIGEQFRLPDAAIGYQLFHLTRGQWLSFGAFAVGGVYAFFLRFFFPFLSFVADSSTTGSSASAKGESITSHSDERKPPHCT